MLFQPARIGGLAVRNRIALAPCTRQRARLDGTPTDMMATYYRQRATAGLIVTESIAPCAEGNGFLFAPGLFTREHVAGWRAVTDAVHDEGGAIFAQLTHVGRINDPLLLPDGMVPVAPSAVRPDPASRRYGFPTRRVQRPYGTPRALAPAEIADVIDGFRNAALRATAAGFDGVELHAGTGYLPMQFLGTNTNLRDDEYGGDVERRCRFVLDCVDAMSMAIGAARIAVRLTPGFNFNDVEDADPVATYSCLVPALARRGIAYLQVGEHGEGWDVHRTLRPLFDGAYIAVGGYTRASAIAALESGMTMIAFGRAFIANPDLVARLENDWPLNELDVSTLYTQGAEGYTDYPCFSR